MRVAISIIDHFKSKLDELDNNTDIDTISKDVLDTINREYQNHALQKINMIKLIKECNQKMLKQMDEIKIPSLEDYLSRRYAFSTSKFTCKYCGFIGKNQGSMSAHYRGCAGRKNINGEIIEPNDEDVEENTSDPESVINYNTPIVVNQPVAKPTTVKPKKTKISIST